MNKKIQNISETEVQQALKKFKRQGGLIKQLPDQVVMRNTLVGGKWGIYESPMDSSGSGAVSA